MKKNTQKITIRMSSVTSIIIASMTWISIQAASGADPKNDLKNAYNLYKKGAYSQAIDELNKIRPDKNNQMLIENWLGLCQARLQAFDKAIIHFEKASKLGSKAEDLAYEIGQAYYASNKLREARGWFKQSVEKKFKVGASLYYIGFVNQVLEEYKDALSNYSKIQTLNEDPDQVKQPALLQMAEVKFSQSEKSKNKTEAIAAFQRAADFNPETAVGKQALMRLNQLKVATAPQVPRMKNGTPIAAQAHYLKFSEDFKYDTNVITQADQSLTKVSNTSSFLAKTGVFGKYEWIYDHEWVISPEVDISHTIHTRRSTPSVFQNDNLSFTGALRSRYEHNWMAQPAAFLFDVEFNYMLRDYLQNHSYPFYSRYYNFSMGQRVRYFSAGNTSITANAKLASNEDPGQNAFDPGFSISQNYRVGADVSLNGSFNFDYNRARNDTNDKINYRISTSANFNSVFNWLDVGFSFDFTYIDTRNQKATRGYEKTLSPTLTLKHNFSNGVFTGLNYNFTKNTSLDTANYAYTKHVVGLNLGCQF